MKEIINKLYYWYTIEKFSEFKVEINKEAYYESLPWLEEEKEKNYEIYLGLYKNSDLIDFIIKTYGDKEGLPEKTSRFSCLCIFKVNEKGEYIEKSLKMPTLPYAINELLSGNINKTDSSNGFNDFLESIENIALNELKKVNYDTINKFFIEILKCFKWFDKSWILDRGKFKVEEIKMKKKNNDSDSEETDTYLNSFYLNDIEKLINEVKSNNYGKAFKDFVLQDDNIKRIDIENDTKEIEHTLEPSSIPMGKWPSKYGLSLMQQVAVNTALKELGNSRGVFSVNGPPGTGKTTLLRDVISNIIVNRAKELAEYKNPKDAFKKSNDCIKIKTNKGSEIPFYPYILDENLKEYGITIVSNNNNAVENISKELPELKAIENFEDYLGADYFRDTSDRVLEMKTWGLISATLGKKANCSKFVKDFWWGGFYKIYENQDEKDKVLTWQEEKKRFLDKCNEIENCKNELNKFKEAIDVEEDIILNIQNKNTMLEDVLNNIEVAKEEYENLEYDNNEAKESVDVVDELINTYLSKKPSFFSRVINRNKYKEYKLELEKYNSDKKEALDYWLGIKNNLRKAKVKVNDFKIEKRKIEKEINKNNRELEEINKVKSKYSKDLEGLYPKEYWKKSKDKQQIDCLWITKELNNKRCELFLLALQLHKAFILNAKEPMKNNLGLFMNYLSGNEIQGNYLKYMSEFWNSLFLVVPVISSPFASIQRMYRHLGKEEIGWLLIDEAGQALPQTAIGSIWRSKRVMVVGDPLQVEPVSTIPLSLIEAIGKVWNLEDIVSKTLSVQGMADKINKYGTNREGLWIGCPLRVHRRCENPMFSISNKIAYDNKMIYGTIEKDKSLSSKNSVWIDCGGASNGGKSHYIKEQGEIIYNIIKTCINENKLPDLYVISPFTTVVSGLKKRIRKLKDEIDFIDSKTLEEWIKDSIGTVHTFQGKETPTVIICLGVDEDHEGAANWASSSPNILNVAVTRAKTKVIIVGNKKLWGSKDYFKEALEELG
ncbi:ATP-binding protein [Clostridium sporogenes]|uniref:DEAD/DEAH box helicase n=1 Tax=Clostridium sporogenes TaxID=1509 RepID=UPI001C11C13C|nr:ATP-binding protein [Clostridium sporogenes]MBU5300475.1 ATP-binding protein [Clostridium sporogenes]